MESLSEEEGVCFAIDDLRKAGAFGALRSWGTLAVGREDVIILRFEDLVGAHSFAAFKNLFAYCDTRVPDRTLQNILKNHSFARLSGGRNQGDVDHRAHYRKGTVGDWENHFTEAVAQRFEDVAGDLVGVLGYG